MGLSQLKAASGRALGAADEVPPQFCIQCGTCTVVCPIEYMNYSPRILNAMLTAGSYEDVLRSRGIWACTGCCACTVECPEQVPVTESIYTDAVAAVCPLCQFNLEAFQGQMARKFGEPADLTVGFFTQLVGTALGLDRRALGIHRMLRWQLPEPAAAEGGSHVQA